MLLAEELVLLLLDDRRGTWLVRRPAVRGAVRVALVVELLARRRLSLHDDGVLVAGLSGTTGGDRILEQVAQQVVGQRPAELRRPRRGEVEELLARLRDAGVLRRAWLNRTRHLPRDGHPEARVQARLREALGVDLRPDRHTALLVALVFELGLLRTLLPDEDGLTLDHRAAIIVEALRTDLHYFPTTLEEEARERLEGRDVAEGVGDAITGVGDALEFLEVVVGATKLLSLPVRALVRVLGELP
ncbi:GOLPH3/VPS74 family protein [Serinicoccus kebangsaanensis]|uniref:GOLPH3/VPS74 family protein n=1 Tax=Serinicoccus kebangsaanensis TaxID=2602069 RepID=UPI00124EB752|nr:GPP34 family phosphoprotein [Serinicoccus kebangsaanensis]